MKLVAVNFRIGLRMAILCLGLAAIAGDLFAQSPEPNNAPPESADAALLKELEGDLLEGLEDIPVQPEIPPRDTSPTPEQQKLLDQLEGEDIQPGGEDELGRIARQMRVVEERLAEKELSEKTRSLQDQIVADLDSLIEQIKRQQQQPKQSSKTTRRPQASPEQNVKQPNQPSESQRQSSDKPATDSEERLGEADVAKVDVKSREALVKEVWGHLPDHARQQMQNAAVEQFLPKYQEMIENYFRRLAEGEAGRP